MSYFPFFREIEGEKCLVIGGGKVAARKISRLKGFGVKIKVVAPSIVSDIEAMAQVCDNISVEEEYSHHKILKMRTLLSRQQVKKRIRSCQIVQRKGYSCKCCG
ncbi:MAG: NAD(P)-dependent oxidoreductase [Lachnospira eligens]